MLFFGGMRLALAVLITALALIAVLPVVMPSAPLPKFDDAPRGASATTGAPVSLDAQRTAKALGFDVNAAGRAVAPPRAPSKPPALRLLGTMVAPNTLSIALAEDAQRHGRTLHLDSRVDGWRVATIAHRRIELEDDGGARVTLEVGGTPGGVAQPPGPSTSAEPLRVTSSGSSTSIVVTKAKLAEEIGRVSEQVVASTRIEPVLKGGAIDGFRVRFAPGSPLAGYGLQSDDVLRSINGQKVTPALAIDYASRAMSMSRVELGLERGGKPLSLSVEVQ
jgi:hypothetical protein